MRAGKLRHRIDLKSPTETNDGKGGVTTTWTTDATVWAERYDLKGPEQIQSMQLATPITAKFRIRYRSDVQATWRIVHGDTTYRIVSAPVADARNSMLEMVVQEI